ncbi:MAG: YfhO family protein [Ruminiclostridium sp.]
MKITLKKIVEIAILIIVSVFLGLSVANAYTAEDPFSLTEIEKKLIFNQGSTVDLTDSDNSGIEISFVNFEKIGNNIYRALNKDPQIIVTWPSDTHIENIGIDMSVEDSDNSTRCQIFYLDSEEESFSEKNSVSQFVSEGIYDFDLPDSDYSSVRLDLTNEENTIVTVNRITVYSTFSVNDSEKTDFIWIFIVFTAVFSFFSVLIVFSGVKDAVIGFARKVTGRLSKKQTVMIALSVAVLLTDILIYLKVLIENKTIIYSDIGSDTLFQYFPIYSYVSRAIRSGDFSSLVYSMNIGYGNELGNYSSNINTPLTFLSIIFPTVLFGDGFLPTALIIYRIACSIVSGILCYSYLENFSEKYAVNAVVSYIFSFNGFYMVWGQHYFFSEYCIYQLLVLICIEKYLRRDNSFFIPIAAVSFLCMINSIYLSYMLYLPAAVYAVIRYFMINKKIKAKHFIMKFITMAAQILLGFGCAMAAALPNICIILNSGRVSAGEGKLQQFINYLGQWNFGDINYILQRTVSSGILGTGNDFILPVNYYEAVQLFFSVFIILVIFQFLFTIHRSQDSLRNRILCYLSFFLCVCVVINKGFMYAMYAFTVECNRQMFILFPFFAIISVSVINNALYKKIFSKTGFAVGCAVSLFALCSALIGDNEYNNFVIFTIAVFVIGVVLMIVGLKKKNRKVGYGLCVLLLLNITGEMITSVDRRGNISAETYDEIMSDEASIRTAVEYLNNIDSGMYRTEKFYKDMTQYSSSLLGGYNPVSFYNSTISEGLKEYLVHYTGPDYIINSAMSKVYFMSSPNDNVIYGQLGLKYILSKTNAVNDAVFEYVDTVDGINIYKNRFADSFTTFFDNAVLYSDYLKLGYNERNTILQKAVVVKEDSGIPEKYLKQTSEFGLSEDITETILTDDGLYALENILAGDGKAEIEFTPNWYDIAGTDAYIEVSIVSENDIYAVLQAVNNEGLSYDYRMKINKNEEFQTRYILPRSTEKIVLDIPEYDGCTVNYIRITESEYPLKNMDNPITFDNGIDCMNLTGQINCDRDGLLFIPIPYSNNFEILVDDRPTVVFNANSAFMCIELEKGQHSISIRYIPRMMYIGLIISAVFAALAFAYYMVTRKKSVAADQKK